MSEPETHDRNSGSLHCYPPLSLRPYYQDAHCTIYHGDCREILPQLGTFDLLLTDPPYGIGEKMRGGFDGEWSRGGEREWSTPPEWDMQLATRVVDMTQHAKASVIWGGNYYPLPPMRCWLSWDKMQEHSSGHFELAWTTLDKPTRVFRMCRAQAYGNGKVHPTQKPVGLIQWCLGLVPDAQTIIDPFAGSCTTGVAAKLEGRHATLIEISEKYCEIGAERLRQGVLF